jgi:CubicO group peptidase (beta-lactamase class C family)
VDLGDLLAKAVREHGVPGASVAVLRDGRVEVAAAGVANTRTGEAASPEHLFSYGSITKVLTATAVARLITQGRVNLDAPIQQYLPEFDPPDERAGAITIRHLMSHNSGIVGTIFRDTGRGPDALAQQVALLNEHRLYHRPGALLSYCNSALILLGRLLEVVTDKPWSQAFAEVLTRPLGLETVVTEPEQALRWRHVVGHVPGHTGAWHVEPMPFYLPGHGPAGSTPMGRARDLLTLVQMHLDGGRAADGTPYLDPGLVSEMQRLQTPSAMPFLIQGFGLGWILFDFAGRRIIGHDGGTMASTSFLRIDTERRFAVALLVNATAGLPIYETVMGELFRANVGCWEPSPPPAQPMDERSVAPYLGRYADIMMENTIEWRDGRLLLSTAPNAANAFKKAPPRVVELHVAGPGQFFVTGPDTDFFGSATGLTLSRPLAVFRADDADYLQNLVLSFRRVT